MGLVFDGLDVESDELPCDAWVNAWHRSRVRKGLTYAPESMSHYTHHIRVLMGGKHIRDWTQDDARLLSRNLDEKVGRGEIAWSTATKIWGTGTKMGADSCSSKLDELRRRNDSPFNNVKGPDRGEDKALQFLYPSEFMRYVSCEDIPLRWRRLVAIGVYTFIRAGALKALQFPHINLEHLNIHVHRAVDRKTKKEKATKTKRARRVRIEQPLLPLFFAMHREAEGKGHVIKVPRDASRTFKRQLLHKACIDRAELFETTSTSRAIRFHDLRATGVTWLAIRGDDPLKIKQRAGHEFMCTTERYVRTAEELRVGFGQVFPELPIALLGDDPEWAIEQAQQAIVQSKRPDDWEDFENVEGIWRKRTGIEPARDSITAPLRF